MKPNRFSFPSCAIPPIAIVSACLVTCGCSRNTSAPVAQGVIYSVAYKDGDGKVHGFTRLNQASAVPGGNGAWNIDAYGKLTPDFLVINRPRRPDLGPQVIPAQNLIEIQFGDGGIKNVKEVQSAAAR